MGRRRMLGLVKERRMRKRMGTGLEIGQGWVIMKMENWVFFGCLCFVRDRGLGFRTDTRRYQGAFWLTLRLMHSAFCSFINGFQSAHHLLVRKYGVGEGVSLNG